MEILIVHLPTVAMWSLLAPGVTTIELSEQFEDIEPAGSADNDQATIPCLIIANICKETANILLRPQSLEFGVNKHIAWSTVCSTSAMINISVKTNDNAAAGVMHGLSHTANVQHRHPQIIISCLKTESIANMIVMSSC